MTISTFFKNTAVAGFNVTNAIVAGGLATVESLTEGKTKGMDTLLGALVDYTAAMPAEGGYASSLEAAQWLQGAEAVAAVCITLAHKHERQELRATLLERLEVARIKTGIAVYQMEYAKLGELKVKELPITVKQMWSVRKDVKTAIERVFKARGIHGIKWAPVTVSRYGEAQRFAVDLAAHMGA